MKIKISEISTTDSIPHNLSLKERKALRELKNDTDLIINKADEGSSICCGLNELLIRLYKKGLLNKKQVDFCSPQKKLGLLPKKDP